MGFTREVFRVRARTGMGRSVAAADGLAVGAGEGTCSTQAEEGVPSEWQAPLQG